VSRSRFLLSRFLRAVLNLFLKGLLLIETSSTRIHFLHIFSFLEVEEALGVLLVDVHVRRLLTDLIARRNRGQTFLGDDLSSEAIIFLNEVRGLGVLDAVAGVVLVEEAILV
jgi:hypothetical protein